MQANETNNRLTRDEVDFYIETATWDHSPPLPRPEMAGIRAEIERKMLNTEGPNPRRPMQSRHMDQPVVFDLAAHPAIIDRIAGLLGPDIVVWTTNFWLKESGGAEIPWHQDINFWPIEPPVNVSAWIAIDEVTVENSCSVCGSSPARTANSCRTSARQKKWQSVKWWIRSLTMRAQRSIWN